MLLFTDLMVRDNILIQITVDHKNRVPPAKTTSDKSPVVGFLGAAKSDNTIAIANLCNVLKIPQISYASTSLDLDDSEAYPYFLRTVPSDQLQAEAIVEIIRQSHLTHASMITTKQKEFCIAFQYKLQQDWAADIADKVLGQINETELSVIVLFSDIERTKEFFGALKDQLAKLEVTERDRLREKVLKVTYIGSDSWSSDQETFTLYHRDVFRRFIGVGVYTKDIKGFKEHLQTLNSTNYNTMYDNMKENFFLKWYEEYRESTGKDWQDTIGDSKLDDHSSTTADAVHAFGQGLLEYINASKINSSFDTVTSDLFDVLKELSFHDLTGNKESTTLHFSHQSGWSRRKSTSPCCHECVDCAAHEHSNGTTTMCYDCADTYTHNEDHTGCVAVTPDFISFTSSFAVILYILIAGGLVAVAGIVVIFVRFLCWVSCLFLCVSCLTKTVIIKLRALQITKFYIIQLLILVVALLTQVFIMGLVLFFKPMKYQKKEILRGKVFGECHFQDDTPRMDILLYISCFVIFVGSLVLSFLGRNINENYNEGKFLAFQVIAMHIVIVAFIPTIMLLEGPVLSGAWAVAIVIMCFIVLIVLFTPKLYIVIYRPYKNQFIEELMPEIPRTNGVISEENSVDL
ncbi:extracellular calcium-sensing receptor-like [Bolinopsis microptera]|uniref:extracellular calcium-sensing receptor-like n=1 Tax=Bolinopsis microptera TaxID=2820187 RepID=UPI00307A5E23